MPIDSEQILMKNVGQTDRVVRLVVAAVLFSLFFLISGPLRWISLLGFVPLYTGLMGTCYVYTLLGMNTCPVPVKKR